MQRAIKLLTMAKNCDHDAERLAASGHSHRPRHHPCFAYDDTIGSAD